MRIIFVGWLLLWCLAAVGWVMNLLAVFNTMDIPMTGMFIVRVIGIFVPPIGAVVGWI